MAVFRSFYHIIKAMLCALVVCFVLTNAYATCGENQIEYNNTCIDSKFEITTTEMSAGAEFKFRTMAIGEFWVDWGDGNVDRIEREPGTQYLYSHTYTSSGDFRIRFGGRATGYSGNLYTAISFEPSADKIAAISGSLGQIFPTLNDGSSDNNMQPQFNRTFYGAYNLKTLPQDLFSGVHGASLQMFSETFGNCSGLTSLPVDANGESTLFKDIDSSAQLLFSGTFSGCSGLTSIPHDLFDGITNTASSLFSGTFEGCSGLKTIPHDLFSKISTPADSLFNSTFGGCTGLTEIPHDLFANISGYANYMFFRTFSNCTSLTSIPADLFINISTAASYMFAETFAYNSSLRIIPKDLFSNISTLQPSAFQQTFYYSNHLSAVTDGEKTQYYIPSDYMPQITSDNYASHAMYQMFQYTAMTEKCLMDTYKFNRVFNTDLSPKAVCAPCPEGTHYSGTGATSVEQCCPDGYDWNSRISACKLKNYTITYYSNGGTSYSTQNYNKESETIILPTPTRDYYEFNGWYDNYYLEGEPVTKVISGSTGDKTFYAKWSLITCPDGYYLQNDDCNKCPGAYTSDGTTATTINDCFKQWSCPEISCPEHSENCMYIGATSGTDYYGSVAHEHCQTSFDCPKGYEKSSHIEAHGNTPVSLSNVADASQYGEDGYWVVPGTELANSIKCYKNGDISSCEFLNTWPMDLNPSWESTFDYGSIYGNYKCSALSGTTDMDEYDDYTYSTDSAENVENAGAGTNCWCKTVGYKPSDGSAQETVSGYAFDGDFSNFYASDWPPLDCNQNCSADCAWLATSSANFRSSLFSVSSLNMGPTEQTVYSCDINTYTITYVSNGGTEYDTVNYTVESETIALPTPTRDNYIFAGWYTTEELTGDAVSEVPAGSTGDKTFYAKWTLDMFVCESGIWLHIGDNTRACLSTTKVTSPALAVQIGNDKYYLQITEDTDKHINENSDTKMHIYYNGREYNIHDASVTRY